MRVIAVLVGADSAGTMPFSDTVIQMSDLSRVAADILPTVLEDRGPASVLF